MAETRTPILVAGGEPVGLCLAMELGWYGVSFILVNERSSTATTPREARLTAALWNICGALGLLLNSAGSDDRSITRTVEISHYLHRLGVDLGVVTTPRHVASFSPLADSVYATDGPAATAPLVDSVPAQILSFGLAGNLGGSMYGMGETVHREDGDPQIYESAIVVE